MTKVLLAIHLLVALALVAVVLLQRSEGGALGIGGGGFMSGRGAANLLTRLTAILAAVFFATSIILTILARQGTNPSIFEGVSPPAGAPASAPEGGKSVEGAAPPPAREAPASPPAPSAPPPK